MTTINTTMVITAIRPATLTKDFLALENKIRMAMKSWEVAGEALQEINAGQMYVQRGFKSFEAYVETIFDMSRDYAYKIMRGFDIVMILKGAGFKAPNLPLNESQVRPLTGIKDDDALIITIWGHMVDSKSRITAKLVKDTMDTLMGKGKGAKDPDENKEGTEGNSDKLPENAGDSLPDTGKEDEITRLTHELAEARQRAAIAESKLAMVQENGRLPLTKLQREMIQAGFKALAMSADDETKKSLKAEKEALLK